MSTIHQGKNMINQEVVFEDQGWAIKAFSGYEGMYDSVFHKCPWKTNWLFKQKPISTYVMKNGEHCGHCGADIPDSIMGVWKLKNFDLIQQHAEYEKLPAAGNSNIFIGYNSGFYLQTTGSTNVLIGSNAGSNIEFYQTGAWTIRPGGIYTYEP